MADYPISKEAVVRKLINLRDELGGPFAKEMLNMALARLEGFPPMDAVPVVHGRWVHDDLGHTYCSKCHERLPYIHCYSEEPCSDYDEEWDEEIPETRYCPNCGAKMEGGVVDG